MSRLEFVQAAVNSQLHKMKTDFPNRKVGIISFSSQVFIYPIYINKVTVWGDGSDKPKTISGNLLHDYSQLLENAEKFTLEKPISQTCEVSTTLFNFVIFSL